MSIGHRTQKSGFPGGVLLAGVVLALGSASAWADQPTPGALGFQPAVTEIGVFGHWMHDQWLMPIITATTVFVLGLLLWIVLRYRRSVNPVPARFSHNTLIEVIWTLVPCLILVAIAIPSFRLLYAQYDPPKADLTLKVTGRQWYWSYEYQDESGIAFDSVMLSDEDAAAQKLPRLLGTDTRVVVPEGKTVKLLLTSSDVIHSFAIPAFFLKMDAVPGRINETWFKADKPGIYYGQCSELCGIRHAFMPIMIEVKSQADFDAWLVEAKQKYASAHTPQFAVVSGPNAGG